MSLAIDTIFVDALKSNTELMELLGETETTPPRLWGAAIPMPEQDAANVPDPIIIVLFSSLTNEGQTKDNPYEGDEDSVNIAVKVTGRTLDELHQLTQMVRDTIRNYMMTQESPVEDYQFAAQSIMYDDERPCYHQVLTYQCDTLRDYEYERENDTGAAAGATAGGGAGEPAPATEG